MTVDRYTKVVLTAIALFLGMIALRQSSPSTARADVAGAADFSHLQVTYGFNGFMAFDSQTGNYSIYGLSDNGKSLTGNVTPQFSGTLKQVGKPVVQRRGAPQ